MNAKIIDPAGVVAGEIENTIIYGNGAHSKDLRNKGLLPTGTGENTAHHIILPIITVESAVLELLEQGISQGDIISYAGVMAKAPNGIPSVHALWGPAATTNLKIAVAMETFGKGNMLMSKLLERMTSNGVAIIETDKPEHDSKMAVIQGLINLWLVTVGEVKNEELINRVIQHWKTPVGTIVDMIHANPFAEILIKKFFGSLERHDYDVSAALESLIQQSLTATDIEKFGTPNSHRVMEFVSQKTGKIVLSSETIAELQRELNTHGHKSLSQRIKRIRGQ